MMCTCDACQEQDPLDAETEADELDILGMGILVYLIPGDRYEWIAGNVKGYQLVWETHEV